MEKRSFVSKNQPGVELNYLYYAPNTDEKLPLFIYIHGAGSRGSDINLLSDSFGIIEGEKRCKDKAVFIAPQCHTDYWFDLFTALKEFIDTFRNADNVDINRVYHRQYHGYKMYKDMCY
jgi:predicted peptidase